MISIRKQLLALPFFSQIKAIEDIEEGASHYCFKVITGNGTYFAKYFESDRATRKNEHNVAVLTAKAGISPCVLHCSTHWLITDFIEVLKFDDQGIDEKIIITVGLINKCHQIKSDLAPLDLHAIVDYLVNDKKLTFAQANAIRGMVKKLPDIKIVQPLVVCHGDVNFSNVLFTENPCLIDFEYACLAEPEYDLAMMIAINLLNAEQQKSLLSRYEKLSSIKISDKNIKLYLSYCYLINGLWCLLKPARVSSDELAELAIRQFVAFEHLTGYNAQVIVEMR